MEIRNTSPLGDLDVTLLGRVVMAGEVIDVTEEQAVELCSALASFAPVAGEDLAAVLVDIPAEGLVVGDTDFVLPADALPANDAAAEEPTKTKARRGAATDDTKEA